jgi:hypothetical protein
MDPRRAGPEPRCRHVVLMSLIAPLSVKPTLLGWIGFAIVAVVGVTIDASPSNALDFYHRFAYGIAKA